MSDPTLGHDLPTDAELRSLYDAVGWSTYTDDLGRLLVDAAFAPYVAVRQHVLLTDDEPGQRAFYEALGFSEIRDLGEGRLRAFVRFS
jgi:hypothetical protein